ncbi:ABC transporter permease [Pseudotamlana agarivorans]|uniref:ABC transporter permease n=1 Tax=Pseudotamlana agarivorans TaxID=481183 RepID=UPI000834FB7C|nr:ABC transporter permease [Tamlana agarivorans]
MNLWKLSFKNMQSKALFTLLSVLAFALSIALLLGVQQIEHGLKQHTENSLGQIDLVVGAKGSPLQLVLSAVLHMDNPTGNISYTEALRMAKNPMIKTAVPISYGDNYKGYKIVGTQQEFTAFYKAKIHNGIWPKNPMEVVLGATVAKRLKLRIGDSFLSSHGLIDNAIDVHNTPLIVVGTLAPTNKVIDRLILTNLESVWEVHDHESGHHHEVEENHEKEEDKSREHDHEDEEKGDHDHNEAVHEKHHDQHQNHKEITALLINFRNPVALLNLPRSINKNTNMQAALPNYEIERLQQFTGLGLKTLSWIAYGILTISSLIIFINLYKMVKERAFDLALLRTYGAQPLELIKIVSYEAFFVGIIASIFGLALSQIGLYVMVEMLSTNYQQALQTPLPINNYLQTLLLVFLAIIVAIMLAIYPIIKMNISNILSRSTP